VPCFPLETLADAHDGAASARATPSAPRSRFRRFSLRNGLRCVWLNGPDFRRGPVHFAAPRGAQTHHFVLVKFPPPDINLTRAVYTVGRGLGCVKLARTESAAGDFGRLEGYERQKR